MTYADELKTTWKTLVGLRDMALDSSDPDWNRVSYVSNTIGDIALMIQSAGEELPDLSEVRR